MDIVEKYESGIRQLIQDNIGDNTIYDIILNFDSGRLLLYYKEDSITKSGKPKKQMTELGIKVLDQHWIGSWIDKYGIGASFFNLYLSTLLDDMKLSFDYMIAQPFKIFFIPVGHSSYSINSYKTKDLFNNGEQTWDYELYRTEQFIEELAKRIKAQT